MARDAGGVSRVNMFEEPVSSIGERFTVVRGTETSITWRDSQGREFTTRNYRMSGDELAYTRDMQRANETPTFYGHR